MIVGVAQGVDVSHCSPAQLYEASANADVLNAKALDRTVGGATTWGCQTRRRDEGGATQGGGGDGRRHGDVNPGGGRKGGGQRFAQVMFQPT